MILNYYCAQCITSEYFLEIKLNSELRSGMIGVVLGVGDSTCMLSVLY